MFRHSFGKHFNEKFNEHFITPMFGVGYRFLVEDAEVIGDWKVEPLIADKTKYYHQAILNTKAECLISDVFEMISLKLKSSFLERSVSIIKGDK